MKENEILEMPAFGTPEHRENLFLAKKIRRPGHIKLEKKMSESSEIVLTKRILELENVIREVKEELEEYGYHYPNELIIKLNLALSLNEDEKEETPRTSYPDYQIMK